MPLAATSPPTAPAIPPIPVTDPTARRGKVSDTRVYRFADQPWWAAAARLMTATVAHRLWICDATNIGVTHRAHASRVTLRAAFTLCPRRMSHEDSQPPAMLPTSAVR